MSPNKPQTLHNGSEKRSLHHISLVGRCHPATGVISWHLRLHTSRLEVKKSMP